MRDLNSCFKYIPEVKRVTKANSFIASGREIYIVKKDHIGKSIKAYNAYDLNSKVQLCSHWNKDLLIKYIQGKDLTMLGGNTQLSLF